MRATPIALPETSRAAVEDIRETDPADAALLLHGLRYAACLDGQRVKVFRERRFAESLALDLHRKNPPQAPSLF